MESTELSLREEVALRLMAAMIQKYGLPDDDVKNAGDCSTDTLNMADAFLKASRG